MHKTKDEFLKAVLQIVNDGITKGNIHPDQIATQLSLSPMTFRRRMKAVTDMTPAKIILYVRLQKAINMLKDYPFISITEVANRCGFADNSHFTKVFKRFMNVTPVQYVKNPSAYKMRNLKINS